jgi:hypothetical protein
MGEIRTKLLYKACFRFKIVNFTTKIDDNNCDESKEDAADPPVLNLPIVSDYRDKTHEFD